MKASAAMAANAVPLNAKTHKQTATHPPTSSNECRRGDQTPPAIAAWARRGAARGGPNSTLSQNGGPPP
eukprot:11228077-Lingulodinium_polyedra.AAC.1